ncbi:MAG: T9SS type A sorting domain-containing protein, partial [Saprospiraceae bacterium]|nr:T9SS type A sorting domain-containing protein [Saprospiraceae bacterium]
SEQVLIRMEAPFRQISIFNATGTLVRHIRQPALTEQVTVSQLPAGTYFVQFEKDGAVWTTRFMKI